MLRVADRVAFIEGGRVMHQATPAALSAELAVLLRYVGARGWSDRRGAACLRGPGRSDRIGAHPSRSSGTARDAGREGTS